MNKTRKDIFRQQLFAAKEAIDAALGLGIDSPVEENLFYAHAAYAASLIENVLDEGVRHA